ncbi:MAG: PQQ-binding-like beta-propeller repeat protein [Candidatus Eremiobacteraeota bacterium]|nr:PQQ-binding-like beta-propeller repeat protein [Candidatus Eremiobacteraeota bacterium]
MSRTAGVAFILLGLVAPNAPAGAYDDPGVMFRADARHLGLYESASPTLKSVRWRFRTGGRIFSSPTVHAGLIFVGSADDNEYAVKESDGSRVWKFATKGPVRSSAAVAYGSVFFSSADGNVYAVDEARGSQRWRFRTGGERRFTAPGIHGMLPHHEMMPDPYDLFLSSPAVSNGTVYVGSGDHNIYALDARSGALRWKFATGNVVHASPAVDAGMVFVGSWDRYFYALNARTGAMLWKFATGDDRAIYNQVGIAGSAAVANGRVFFGCRDSHFYSLDERTGALIWKRDHHGSWVIASPAILRDTVYYTTSDERKFYAVDAGNGTVRFSVPYGTFAYSSPAIAGNVAYFGSFDGRLYGVDIGTGKVVATFSTDGSARQLAAHLTAAGEVDLASFYGDDSSAEYPTLDGTIVSLNALYNLGSIVGSPAIDGGTLFIGTAEGTLYAIE